MAISTDAMLAMVKKMTPDQLKQFATMHANDILAMSAVSAVQSERDKANMARQAQQANTNPPKVTQQLAQSIPTEESGIAGLPAQNMTYAAEGGIMGYAGDGPQGQVVRSSYFPEESLLGKLSDWQAKYPGLPLAALMSDEPHYKEMREKARLQGEENRLQRGPVGSVFVPGGESGLRPDVTAARAQTDSTRPGAGLPKQLPPGGTPPSGVARTSAGAARPAAAAATPPQDIEALYKQAQKMAGAGTQTDPDAAARAEILASRQAQAERERADAQQRAEGLQSLLKPREERIAKREAALEKQGEVDKSMAIINAGLAMMQSTGPGLSGIAEGAAKGVKQYGESMALSKAERQKISDAQDAYDELKFNSQNLSQKEITAAKNKIDEAANISKEGAMSAAQKRLELDKKSAEAIFKETVGAQTAALDRASRERVAGMQISAAGARADANEPKQRLAELKSMQTNLLGQLKTTMPYGASKADYLKLQAQLAEVNQRIAKMAGLDTMSASPGAAAAAPAQKLAPLESFYK